MERYIHEFEEYLAKERSMAKNSLEAYRRDIAEFAQFLSERGTVLRDILNPDIVAYLLKLKNDGKAKATINRKIASIRAFGNFMIAKGHASTNQATNIKSPKIDRKKVTYLTIEEVELLLSIPDTTLKGQRDRAILEILYATGIRVSEIVELDLPDVNLRIGFISCSGEHGKARIIPLGRPARAALEEYIYSVRPKIFEQAKKDATELQALFVNTGGERLTRQGLWKIIKSYAGKAGVEDRLTPHTLRNSFAVHMVQNGADLKSLQELLGHEDLATTQVYLEVTKTRIKEVYDNTHPRA